MALVGLRRVVYPIFKLFCFFCQIAASKDIFLEKNIAIETNLKNDHFHQP